MKCMISSSAFFSLIVKDKENLMHTFCQFQKSLNWSAEADVMGQLQGLETDTFHQFMVQILFSNMCRHGRKDPL